MAAAEGPTPDEKRRSPWRWVSLALAVVAVGLLVWALAVKSDRESTQDDLDAAQQELASTQQQLDAAEEKASATPTPEDGRDGGALAAVGGLAAAKSVYDDLTAELGATEEELAATKQDLEEANAQAEQSEQDAAAAKKKADQAGDATDKAEAESDQAKAEAKAAESKATVVADCTKAYFTALGTLFEGDDVQAQATGVRKQLEDITDQCRAALGGT